MLQDIPVPETMPYFGHAAHLQDLPHFTLDDDNNLWVLDYAWKINLPTNWTVYDRDGATAARVSLPPRHAPTHIGSDFIVLLVRDDLDVETVQVHQLRR